MIHNQHNHEYRKQNEKKRLHKHKKQWIILSTVIFGALGASGYTATNVNADTAPNPNSTSTQTNANSTAADQVSDKGSATSNNTVSQSPSTSTNSGISMNANNSSASNTPGISASTDNVSANHTSVVSANSNHVSASTNATTNTDSNSASPVNSDTPSNSNSHQSSANQNLNAQLAAVFVSDSNNNSITYRDGNTANSNNSNSTSPNSTASSAADNLPKEINASDSNGMPISVATHAVDMGYDKNNIIASAAIGGATISVDKNGNALIGPGTIKDTDIQTYDAAKSVPVYGMTAYDPVWQGIKDANGNSINNKVYTVQFDNTNLTTTQNNAGAFGSGILTALPNVSAIDYSNTTGWDKMTDMSHMFNTANNYHVTSINLGNNFDTSNVTDMNNFIGSNSSLMNLKYINFGPKFDTTNVQNLSHFIGAGNSLQNIDFRNSNFNLTNWNPNYNMQGLPDTTNHAPIFSINTTSSLYLGDHIGKINPTNIDNAFLATQASFSQANPNATIDFGNLDLSNVTSMQNAFVIPQNIQPLIMGPHSNIHFDSNSGVTTQMYNNGHGSLISLNTGTKLSGIYTNSIITPIPGNDTYNQNINKFDPDHVIDTFQWGSATGQTDDRGNTIISNGTIYNFLKKNAQTENIPSNDSLGKIRTLAFNNVTMGDTDASYMFSGYNTKGYNATNNPFGASSRTFDNLNQIDVSGITGWNKVTNMAYMFGDPNDNHNYRQLNNIILGPNFDSSNVTNMDSMFAGDHLTTPIDLKNLRTDNVQDMSFMFYDSMYNADSAPYFVNNTPKLTNINGMFSQAGNYGWDNNNAPITIDLSNMDLSHIMPDMGKPYTTNLNDIYFGNQKVIVNKIIPVGLTGIGIIEFKQPTKVYISGAAFFANGTNAYYQDGIQRQTPIDPNGTIFAPGTYYPTRQSSYYHNYSQPITSQFSNQDQQNQNNTQQWQQAVHTTNDYNSHAVDIIKQAQLLVTSLASANNSTANSTANSMLNSLTSDANLINSNTNFANSQAIISPNHSDADSYANTAFSIAQQGDSASDKNTANSYYDQAANVINKLQPAANSYQSQSAQLASEATVLDNTANSTGSTYNQMTLDGFKSLAASLANSTAAAKSTAQNTNNYSNQTHSTNNSVAPNTSTPSVTSDNNPVTSNSINNINSMQPQSAHHVTPQSSAQPNNNTPTNQSNSIPSSSAQPQSSSNSQTVSQATKANDDKHTIKPGVQIHNIAHQPYDKFDTEHDVNTSRAINQHRIKYVQNGKTKYVPSNQSMTVQKQVDLGNGKTQVTATYKNQLITFTTNNYNLISKYYRHGEVQKDLNKTTDFKIKTLRPIRKHTKLNFTDKGKHVKVGSILHVKRIRVYKHITRFDLTDGTSIATSNKLFVKLIK